MLARSLSSAALAFLLVCCSSEPVPTVRPADAPLSAIVEKQRAPAEIERRTERLSPPKPEEKPLPPDENRAKLNSDLEWVNSYLHSAHERSK